ncbi:DUF6401 family natural product biosynthesis protein [Amycolatopsis sp. FDAARGOS 1241]|uniref:DUF6401 family natural product biosynthesis protein n=1 Tax=Amycolatopsis sp. FDAARGOS 1241 TaxID=2778070 RepID=UPI00194F98F2|nr:DUF6401 family natural product biosynthesis protein [Amycolatopsis sp. FDAARGOS 1241]QRP42661.1 hypothetical protein I6J71_24470 [Amycolatopsis sp. FDAARGOS 1241]QRP48240.1 hypothetical protein I6J71_10375 [Amycolatopsis sp. FDAARGOS 1241]
MTGLAGMAAVPALAAAVDQHAAAVRDILVLGVEGSASVAAAVLLASYARGLIEQVELDSGRAWSPAVDAAGWAMPSWLQLRLLAVCQLARGHRSGPLTDDQAGLPSLA